MTTIQSISTVLIIGLFGSFQTMSTDKNEFQKFDPDKILEQLQGTWTLSNDTLATVKISENIWTFIYEDESTSSDSYQIAITDSLPLYVDPKNNSEFLILANQNDTLNYEIFGINDSILSLMYFPRGNIHVYKRKKK